MSILDKVVSKYREKDNEKRNILKILLTVDESGNSLWLIDEAIKIASLIPEYKNSVIYVTDFEKAKNEILHLQGKAELEYSRRKKLAPVDKKQKKKYSLWGKNITLLS